MYGVNETCVSTRQTPDMGVVTPLNNPGGPEGDTVTVAGKLLNTEYCQTIAAGASGHQDCVCVPGFAGLPVPDPVHCQECPADTYADVHNTSTCVPCPEHASHAQTKRTHVSACLCDPGYSCPDGGPCVACAAGTFKAEPGAAACEDCGVNEYSYAAAAVCVSCHANSSSLPRSPGVDHCLCDPGFYPSEGLCSMP